MKARFKDPAASMSWPLLDEDGKPAVDRKGKPITVDIPPGTEFDCERSPLLGRVVVDFDPGPDLRIGVYSEEEFEATFTVIEE